MKWKKSSKILMVKALLLGDSVTSWWYQEKNRFAVIGNRQRIDRRNKKEQGSIGPIPLKIETIK
jgi:hypothetical protein